jgi:hypothetical protein
VINDFAKAKNHKKYGRIILAGINSGDTVGQYLVPSISI